MNLNLAGKKVLVTGSSHGIGLHIARQFSAEGCRVALNGRTDIALDVIDSVPGSFSVIGDVSNERGAKKVIEESVQKLGGLDVVICNVGSGRSVKPGQENIKAWKDAFDINFYSTTCVVEAARSYLKVSQGVIITISSICGCQVIPAAPVTYSVAKAALNAYVKGIARPLGDDGIRICGIAPGNILFEGSVWDAKLSENPDSVSQMLDQEVPLHKLGTPAEVASLALFLASPKSNYSTGDVWIVDGGQTR
jgi:3-oxoacyl-[acyl-carrier protein] reductase